MSDAWIDDAAGPLVRSFALTGGRAHPKNDAIDLLTYVVATDSAEVMRRQLHPEQQAIIDRARVPASVAEIASYVDLPVGVVRVLLSDLAERNAIAMVDSQPSEPDDELLQAVINGLQSL
jgi:hypothetical protein